MAYLIDFWGGGVGSPSPFIQLTKDSKLATPTVLGDGWSVYYTAAPQDVGRPNLGSPTTGDAAWVVSDVADGGHWTNDNAWRPLVIKGPASTSFTFETFASGPSGRVIEMRLNGGASLVFDETNNKSVVQTISGSTDANGDALFEWRSHSSSSGATYLNASRLTPGPPPASITIDAPMTPGGTSVLTYDNFDAAPTGTVTATPLDGSGDPITGFTPLTYTGTVSDTDTAGVHSGTVTVNWPALVDGQTTLPFGTNNVRLSITS